MNDWTQVCCFFLNENENKLKNQTDIYSKKHFNLSIESFKTPQDPQNVRFNYCSHVLIKSEKSSLCKGLAFAISPDELKCSDSLLPFEFLSRNVQNLDVTDQKKQL